ncbi:MAG: carbohydrate binding domain-containing protein, partial [Ruminococcus sp.]|nr:carbohydrate binding domain-containing protein [Ruminococcus sp.]
MYHDASLFFDDDGRNYLVYGAGGTIKIKELNAEMTGFKSGGADKELFSTGLDGLSGEGSHIQKIGDYYYIFLIAWPSNSGRIELCYRSKDILGSYEGKTILNSDGAAQGGIVDTPDGKWYGLVFEDHGAVGRIPVLVPVTWQNDWPIMGKNGKVPKTITVDGSYSGTFLAADDDFSYSSNNLALEWQWNHNPDNTAWSVTERKGYLRLKNKTLATNVLNARNTLTQRTEGPACSSVIKLDTSNMKVGDYAGLSAFQYKYGNVGVYVADDGSKKIYMAENGIAASGGDVADSYNKIIEETNLSGNEIYLKADFKFNDVDSDLNISYNLDKANFYYSYDGSNWTKIGNELSMSYDLKLFTGYRSAIYSYATKTTGGYADIDFFDYERADWNQPTEVKPNSLGWYFNNGFENDSEGWTGRGAAKVASNSQTAYVGSNSLYVSDRTAAWNGAQKSLSTSVFKPGNEYSFSANVKYKSGNATDTFFMKLQYVDGNGDTQYTKIAESTAIKGEWVQLANSNFTIPSDATNMYLYIETEDSTNSFYLDEAIGAVGGTGILGAGSQKIILGDINSDGAVDCFDLVLARKGYIDGFDSTSAQIAADVNQSGAFDKTDLVLLQDFLLGKIAKFPTESVTPPESNQWDTYQETASPEMQKFYSDAIYQIGNTARIREKIEKVQNGKNVTLAYIGGSITEGGRTDTCYASRSYKYFADTFGTGNNVSMINAGLSGTSSVVGLMRAQNDILDANPDVIFIEFSVNDHPEEIYKKGYESLVKKCLSQPNNPAVILIINRAKGGYSMQEQMVAIGKNYNLPIISMDNALTNAFNSGLLTTDDYYTDEYHPHEKGNALISDSIAYFYRQALKTVNKSESYTIPTSTVYGTEYSTGSIVSLNEQTNFNSGSFTQTNSGYATLPYTLKHASGSGDTPITFSTKGKGIFIVYSAKDDANFGNINVTVNGKTSKISGNKLYAWGGPEADVAYIQNSSGDLNVSINVENAGTEFTIWGIGVVK